MKKIVGAVIAAILVLASFGGVLAAAPTGFVNDEAGVLTSEQKSELENLAVAFETETGNEIAVLTTPKLVDETIEMMAVRVFEEWKIGKKGADNGVLILLAIEDREVRIEVGYGLEGVLTDLKSSQIINQVMIPELRNGNYYGAISGAMNSIMGIIQGEEMAFPVAESGSNFNSNWIGIFFLVGYLVLAIFGRTKSWWLGGVLGAILGWFLAGLAGVIGFALLGLIIDFILSRIGQLPIVKKMGDNIRKSQGSSGWGGGRSGGGGFGGFSGGSSGGGGSSGKW